MGKTVVSDEEGKPSKTPQDSLCFDLESPRAFRVSHICRPCCWILTQMRSRSKKRTRGNLSMEAQDAMTMKRMKRTVRAFGFHFLGLNFLRFGALGFIYVLFSFGFCGLIGGLGF
jgi:hypothetical protein